MPPHITRIPTDGERAAALLREEAAVRSHLLGVFLRGVVLCFLWMAVGLYLIAWAVHTTDEGLGAIAFWGGLLVGNAGILITLGVTYSRAMEEGWIQ